MVNAKHTPLPVLWRTPEAYWLDRAVWLWLVVFGEAPLKPSELARSDWSEERAETERLLRRKKIVHRDDSALFWIRVFLTDKGQPLPAWREFVYRKDLDALATELGEPDAFKLPDRAITTKSKAPRADDEVSPREEPSLLKVLAAVIDAKYGSEVLTGLADERSTKTGMIIKDVEVRTGQDPKTIRQYLKRLGTVKLAGSTR